MFSLFYSDKGNKGTGLGLFIAQRSVKKHQGVIHIDSIPGEFTEFTIAIPKKTSEIWHNWFYCYDNYIIHMTNVKRI